MIKIKSPNQLNILDPSDWLTLKRRQMLEGGWPGLFQKRILPTLPVHKAAKFFDASLGRPTKELYAMLGALILHQAFDLSDEQTVDQFALNRIGLRQVFFSQDAVERPEHRRAKPPAGRNHQGRRAGTCRRLKSQHRSAADRLGSYQIQHAAFRADRHFFRERP